MISDERLNEFDAIISGHFDGSYGDWASIVDELVTELVTEIRRLRSLKVYIRDRGWSGSTLVIASSLDGAVKAASDNSIGGYGPFNNTDYVETHDVSDGFVYVTLGDA